MSLNINLKTQLLIKMRVTNQNIFLTNTKPNM